MDELTRFARTLVERLGARPEGVHRPVSVAALRREILPYRAERRALGLTSVEDYETILLRLVAEERGLVRTIPAAAAERCREVLSQPNPDLGVLEEIADSMIQVTSLAAAPTVLDQQPRSDNPEPKREEVATPPLPSDGAEFCRHCRHSLPGGRLVVFCPWCGGRVIPLTCRRCGAEFESGWRYCVSCGAEVSDPHPSG